MTYPQRTRCVEPTAPALRTDMVAAPERATRRSLLIGVADQEGSNYNVRVKALMYRSLATGMLVLGIPMAAAAECVSDPDGVLAAESLRAANFVFDGTVLSVDLVAS